MRKLLVTTLLVIFSALTWAQSNQEYMVTLVDANDNPWTQDEVIFVRNSDSLSVSAIFEYEVYKGSQGFLYDVFTIPSSYTNGLVTFSVYTCGTWVMYDTLLQPQDSLNITIKLPCVDENCRAEYSHQYTQSPQVDFQADYSRNSSYNHSWKLDGVEVSTDTDPSININDVNAHTVTHIVTNTNQSCIDSAEKTIQRDSLCNVTLAAANSGTPRTMAFSITGNPNREGVIHFGDGDFESFNFSGNGQFNVVHTYPGNGPYTAIAGLMGNGCQDSASVVVNPIGSCDAGFTINTVQAFQYRLTRNDSSQGTVKWTITGNGNTQTFTGNSIQVTVPTANTYSVDCEVSINGSYACDETKSLIVNKCGLPGNPTIIQGEVFFGNQALYDFDSLLVYHIAYDSVNGTLTGLDSLYVFNHDSGFFAFEVCNPDVIHMFKAALLPGTKYFNNYIPTYSDSSALWSGAAHYDLSSSYAPIYLKTGNNTGGPGFIGGYISQGANKKGDALNGIQVLLLSSAGEPVASTYSFNSGRYEFDNLAYGQYQVLVEIPGKPSSIYYITLDSDNEKVDDMDFEVNSTDITTISTGYKDMPGRDWRVYPNPTTGHLTIELEEANKISEVAVVDLQGKHISGWSYHKTDASVNLNVSDLPAGIYFIQISYQGNSSFVRFIKQ